MASFDNEHTRGISIALAAATVAWFFQPQAIASVPQILGLVATAEPTELHCADGSCSAAFSSFCLQEDRAAPSNGTAYRLAEGADIALVYTDSDGVVHEIEATHIVSIDSERRYAAVRIGLPEEVRDKLDARRLALSIGAHASAVPKALADSTRAAAVAEIRKVTGQLRRLAETLFAPESESAVAAANALKLINAGTKASSATIDVEALWRIHDDNITTANMRVWNGLEAARS